MNFLENNYNKNIIYYSLWKIANAAFTEKYTVFSIYVDIQNRIKMNQTFLVEIKKNNKISRNK